MPEPLLNDKPPSGADLTLGELWRFCARKAGDRQLASLVIVGVLAAAAAVAIGVGVAPGWMAKWWAPLAPLLAVGSFGVWAIADREVRTHRAGQGASGHTSVVLLATRWLAAATALVAAGIALLYGFFAVLGTWIS